MPCFSNIETKLNDSVKLNAALLAKGFDLSENNSVNAIQASKNGTSIVFSRSQLGRSFSVQGDTSELAGISKAYAEIGLRQWAKRSGFSVTEKQGDKITLQNRRG